MRTIGVQLKDLRVGQGISRVHLAQLVGVNVQTIGALERGRQSPSLDLAMRISSVLGLSVEAVFPPSTFGLPNDATSNGRR